MLELFPGAPWTGAANVLQSSVEGKTRIPAPENCSVERKILPVRLLRAKTGSPTSPLALVGNVPLSAQVAPPSVDWEKPVNFDVAIAGGTKGPESLNAEQPVSSLPPGPKTTSVVSL